MEFIAIVGGLLLLVVAYFCFGIVVKFFVAWWPLIVGWPILLVVGFAFGWIGAIVAVVGFAILLGANNRWQGSTLYAELERKIDKAFYFSDV